MSIRVEGFLRDIGGASRIEKKREELLASGSQTPNPSDPIRALADALHPAQMRAKVVEIRDASPTSKTYRFETVEENGRPSCAHVPVFQCGQCANFRLKIGTSIVTREYSISSAPYEARKETAPDHKPFFEVTIRRNRPYFVPDWFFQKVQVGDVLDVDLPFGTFYYDSLRDTKNIIALAGGSGITPFASMAKEIAFGTTMQDVHLTILYGSVVHTDIVLGDDMAAAAKAKPDQISIVNIMSGDEDWTGEKGFLTRGIIEKYDHVHAAQYGEPTYFFCGPPVMFHMLEKLFREKGVPSGRFRHDAIAQPGDVTTLEGYPKGSEQKDYRITVVRGIQEDVITASGRDSVAVALEKAAIPVDTHCRAGECGMCRIQLLSGNIYVSPMGDGRRRMDKEMGWFHACSAWPLSDLRIKVPIM